MIPQVGKTNVIALERMLEIQGYIAQSNEFYLLMFAKCIVQSAPNSASKPFTTHHTLLNFVIEKRCLSVRRRKHVVTKFTPNKTLLINDIVRNKTTVGTLYNQQFNWLKLDSSYAVHCDIILTLMGVSSDCINCREGRMMFYQSFPSLGQSVL